MTDNVQRAKQWLDVLARGAIDEWDGLVDENVTLHALFMPGIDGPTIGREANRAMISGFWKSWKHFQFFDVDAHAAADDADLVFVTARSEAEAVWGAAYANTYVFRMRFAQGKVVEHLEMFNPLPVMEVFKDMAPS